MIRVSDPINLSERRRKLPGVDNPVLYQDQHYANGRAYQSSTFVTELGQKPHVLPTEIGRRDNIETMIVVNVQPTQGSIPDVVESTPYETTTKFENFTNASIVVTDRHNLSFTLPKVRYMNPNQIERLVVRKIHRFFNAEIAMSMLYNHQFIKRYLSIQDDERTAVLNRLYEAQNCGEFKNPNIYIEIVIDRIIPISLLTQYASIYVHDVDLMFQFDSVDVGTPHPTSQDAVLQGELLEQLGNRQLTGAFYEIVDNDNKFTSRYVCLGKNAIQVPINRQPGRQPGIYHTVIDNINSTHLRITLDHHPLDKAEELGIFSSKEEAETNGHINEAHKLKMKQLERELDQQRLENTRMEQAHARELAEIQHQRKVTEHGMGMEKLTTEHVKDRLTSEATIREILAKIDSKLESDRIERNALIRKDEFESRSQVRKETSEIFKWAPSAITGLITIGTIFALQHQKNKKE